MDILAVKKGCQHLVFETCAQVVTWHEVQAQMQSAALLAVGKRQ